ncbi:MAG: hypothetical protein A2096_07530 [Spirochaetes bacterium GWF1_41_5]|nr:MAG: hypothetical protein A2096_07530 [Spirochaetes bacterium GWF1_41_5]
MPHEEWLIKAEHDLQAAVMLKSNSNLLDTSVYHTQQCAEKALKAFLVYHKREIEKTHHLKPLLDACSAIDHEFFILKKDVIFLSPFAAEFRYPGECLIPDESDVMSAITSAEKILYFIKRKFL